MILVGARERKGREKPGPSTANCLLFLHLGPDCPRMTGEGNCPFLAITLGSSRYYKSPHIDAPGTHPKIQETCLKFPVLFLLPFFLIQSPNNCIARGNVVLRQVLKKAVASVTHMLKPGPNSLQNSLCTDFQTQTCDAQCNSFSTHTRNPLGQSRTIPDDFSRVCVCTAGSTDSRGLAWGKRDLVLDKVPYVRQRPVRHPRSTVSPATGSHRLLFPTPQMQSLLYMCLSLLDAGESWLLCARRRAPPCDVGSVNPPP